MGSKGACQGRVACTMRRWRKSSAATHRPTISRRHAWGVSHGCSCQTLTLIRVPGRTLAAADALQLSHHKGPDGSRDAWSIVGARSLAILLTIYRGHLGLSARSPKKVSKRVPWGLSAQKVKKSQKRSEKPEKKVEKQLIFDCF